MTEFVYVMLEAGACLIIAFIVPVIIAIWLALYDELTRRLEK